MFPPGWALAGRSEVREGRRKSGARRKRGATVGGAKTGKAPRRHAAAKTRRAAKGTKTKRIDARVDPTLVAAAVARTGVTNIGDLVERALVRLATADDFDLRHVREIYGAIRRRKPLQK